MATNAVTRFKRRLAVAKSNGGITRYSEDGPVSGALQVIPIQFTFAGTNRSLAHCIDFPAGMAIKIVDINVQALGIVSDPSLTIGTTKAGTQIVAAVNVTTNLGSLTLKQTDITPGGLLEVRVANDTGDSFDSVAVTIFAYVCDPPTSLAVRNVDQY